MKVRSSAWAVVSLAVAGLVGCGDDDTSAPLDAGLDATVVEDGGAEDGGDASEPDASPRPDAPTVRLSFEPIEIPSEHAGLTDFVFLPGTEELLVTTREGGLLHLGLDSDAGALRVIAETHLEVDTDRECGLISIAIDPAFATNRAIYLGACTTPSTTVVWRATIDPELGIETVAATREVMLSVTGADAGWHNVGALDFGPGRTLHVLFGDKGMADEAQSLEARHGKLLRVVPHEDDSGYEPAPGNPYGDEGVAAEVLALGLRSPWRGFVDSRGRFWVGDVGNHRFEEVNLIGPEGGNYGWPRAEGACATDCEGLVDPLVQYGHRTTEPFALEDPENNGAISRSVWVGLEYRGGARDRYEGRLTGRVLFGDFGVGFVRALQVDDAGRILEHGHVGHLEGASAWREGPDGWIYALGYGGVEATPASAGVLYRVIGSALDAP